MPEKTSGGGFGRIRGMGAPFWRGLTASASLAFALAGDAAPTSIAGLRIGPIEAERVALALLLTPGTPERCAGTARGTLSLFGLPLGAAAEGTLASGPAGCEVTFVLPFGAFPAEILEHAVADVLEVRLAGEVDDGRSVKPADWTGRIPRGALQLSEPAKVTLRRFVKVNDVKTGSVGLTKTTVNVSVDVLVPFRFDFRILEASCSVELNGRDVAKGRREKVLLHGGRSSRVDVPVTLENGEILAAAGRTTANNGKLVGRLKGIGRVKLPTGELDFPFDFPVSISLF